MIDIALNIRRRIGHWLNGVAGLKPKGDFCGPLLDKKRVLIVSCLINDEDRETLKLIKVKMKELCPNAEVFVCCYYEVKQGGSDDFISDGRTVYFSEKDFTFFFKFKRSDIMTFVTSGFDITIFMSGKDQIFTDFISNYVISDLRVGWSHSEIDKTGILNLSISKGENGKSSVKNIVDTLRMVFEK